MRRRGRQCDRCLLGRLRFEGRRREAAGRQRPDGVAVPCQLHRRVVLVADVQHVGALCKGQFPDLREGVRDARQVADELRLAEEAHRAGRDLDHVGDALVVDERHQPAGAGCRCHVVRAGTTTYPAVRMDQEVFTRLEADGVLGHVDAAVQRGRQLAGREARLDRIHAHDRTSMYSVIAET